MMWPKNRKISLELIVNHDVSRERDGSRWDADLIVNGVRQNAELERVSPDRYQAFRVPGLDGAYILNTSPHRN